MSKSFWFSQKLGKLQFENQFVAKKKRFVSKLLWNCFWCCISEKWTLRLYHVLFWNVVAHTVRWARVWRWFSLTTLKSHALSKPETVSFFSLPSARGFSFLKDVGMVSRGGNGWKKKAGNSGRPAFFPHHFCQYCICLHSQVSQCIHSHAIAPNCSTNRPGWKAFFLSLFRG